MPLSTSQRRFVVFSALSLAYTVAAAIYGAYVRASMSGDGCGQHWPLCNGAVVPVAATTKTLVEYTHRVTSAACGVLVIVGVVWANRAYPRGHLARTAARLSLFFVLTEGAVGGALVLLRYVAESQELARGYWMAAHLLNTFAMLAAMALTVLFGAGLAAPRATRSAIGALTWVGGGLVLVTGMSGAIAALGDTLFPAQSLAHGLVQDLSPSAHLFLRLRVLHPIFAIGTAGVLLLLSGLVIGREQGALVRGAAYGLGGLVLAQVGVGFVNLALLAPISLQLVHLFFAYAVWIALWTLSVFVLGRHAASADLDGVHVEPARA